MSKHAHIWADEIALRRARKDAKSRGDMLRKLGISVSGAVYDRLEQHCKEFGIDLDFEDPYGQPKIPDEVVFVENSKYLYNSIPLKKRFIKLTGVAERCVLCGLGSEWNGKPLTLQLDHINGVNNDHRLENLRLLCPNCHTQTDTYAGRGGTRAAVPYSQIQRNGMAWWRAQQEGNAA